MLLCPVRECRLPLLRESKRWVCARGHSFDLARSGYVNLLQPQERKSKQPGDAAAAVAARRRLHDRGVTAPLAAGIAALLAPTGDDILLDAGCGDGFYLGGIAQSSGCTGHGVDISIPAIDAAARRYPGCEWIVANADRAIPYAGASFSAVMSITARQNPEEFHRVLRPDGRLLVAIPAPDDLIELRGATRDRIERTVGEFSGLFALQEHRRITTRAELDAEGAADVLLAIYRPLRAEPPTAMAVTFSLDCLLFGKR